MRAPAVPWAPSPVFVLVQTAPDFGTPPTGGQAGSRGASREANGACSHRRGLP